MLFSYKYGRDETDHEEILNASTHGLGVIFSFFVLIILASHSLYQEDILKFVSSLIFGLTLILTYAISTFYHIVREPNIKQFLKEFDHINIYLLIAGTYTPFTLVTLYSNWSLSLFAVIWVTAFLGALFTVFFNAGFEGLSIIIYLFMGWLGLITVEPIYHALHFSGFMWLLVGGLGYTVGVLFYLWHNLKFNHTIMHLFILLGSVCHYIAISNYVVLT